MKPLIAFFSAGGATINRYAKVKAMLDKLPRAILATAFRGELVPQDENDEPAGMLLERIKAGKKYFCKNKK